MAQGQLDLQVGIPSDLKVFTLPLSSLSPFLPLTNLSMSVSSTSVTPIPLRVNHFPKSASDHSFD
jgi:hypothetical protein